MELNKLLFPAPKSSYTSDLFSGELIWIPHIKNTSLPSIPCIYLSSSRGSSKILVYFHGNAEDLGMSYELLCHLSNALRMHVIGVEYPGYGVYGGQSNEKRILQDAESVYDYLINQLKITEDQIILFGRSIGTGPATWLASEKKVGALLLMSGYTSIRQVAKSIAGKFLMYFIKDRFRNIDWIKKVTVPVFIVHGQSDTLIPYQHSLELHRNCKGPNSLLLPENMNHNEFDFFDDLTIPFSLFLSKFGLNTDFESPGRIEFPSELFSDPSSM